jgi:hypothetical protein
MADIYRKPTNGKNDPIPFSIEAEGQIYAGTLTPDGTVPAFGMPSAFIVRIPDHARMTISVYRGEWQLPAKPALAGSLADFIREHYK